MNQPLAAWRFSLSGTAGKFLPGPALLKPLEITGTSPGGVFVGLQAPATFHSCFGLGTSKQRGDENSQTPFFPL